MNADIRADVAQLDEARSARASRIAEYTPTLLGAARALVSSDAEAHDLVQTTLEIALRRQDDLREPAALRAWLLTIQVREAYRLTRRIRRFVGLQGSVTEVAVASTPDAADLDLRASISHLPRRVRAAVVLHYLAGLSVDETATALGTSRNTVKTQLRDGLGRLREELRDD